MSEISDSRSVYGRTGKRKISACRLDSDEIPFQPDRKVRKKSRRVYVKKSSSRSSVAGRPPHRPAARRRSIVTDCLLQGSAAGEQKGETSDGKSNELEPAGRANDEQGNVNEGEQVAGHLSVDSNNDGDSVKCPVCSVTFTTREVGTPDTCAHIFCAACLQEWTRNKNNCPLDGQMVNFILVRRHPGGEIVTRIPVEPPRQQSECDRNGRELVCDEDIGWGLPLFCGVVGMMYLYRAACALTGCGP
jgi:PHD and RING finger domain-containing protein 1